ncbi:MAG: DUF3240 family protein [gamma proteobacterium symbiont of Bathyaustriella thionipta]|nr:DUF3240 family protein [gamma proteobacterium symbiont of Bathyaustriella thionipta]MCU7949264.1 DUF3240 family protein [gamma proteobacterium symbiont of Bathyaustriella thionipta]MCU7954404.1 DUF3240 family protein [gamma proteobacterium symbiont of Bathyaustriella thionipta]MCU7955875.1 DUF3240 family protein [gamma proteobacterium symbiont of Bathyaustriella thionipta]MCU7966075.1 DUF3240 family protein [gamma proteobacterium symbiont of Bathyaustriella thionipta]
MKKCILKLILDEDLYDEMTDSLQTFPRRELEFMGFSVQAHTQSLENISEQVSGFKQKMLIEITTDENEAGEIYQYVKESLSEAVFEVQLSPLMNFL